MKEKYKKGQRVQFKKKHPCGSEIWEIIRVGMDFKAECTKCGKIINMPKRKFEKSVKKRIDSN